MARGHTCTCTNLDCSLNPNSPKCRVRTCDKCIRKCLKAGEIPYCFFAVVDPDTSKVDDWTLRGFADWVARNDECRNGQPDS
jgi:hypothetical protein